MSERLAIGVMKFYQACVIRALFFLRKKLMVVIIFGAGSCVLIIAERNALSTATLTKRPELKILERKNFLNSTRSRLQMFLLSN